MESMRTLLPHQQHRKSKVVVIGGGTGVFTALSGLKKYPLDLSAIISMADEGGSTGVLREEFGILPPGDVRRALVALAHADDRVLSDLFNYRFTEGGLKGHAFGNIMLTALERLTGSFESALEEAGRVLNIQGKVIPVTLAVSRLSAEFEDGTVVEGESNIDIPKHDPALRIKRVFLRPPAAGNKRAVAAIREADLIVLGPGDLFTSIMPNLLVRGIPAAIRRSRGKKVFVVSTVTKPGETLRFTAKDFLDETKRYLGRNVLDYIVVNTKMPSPARFRQYEKEGREMVRSGNLPSRPVPLFGDFIRRSGFVRHDPDRLAKVLVSLL